MRLILLMTGKTILRNSLEELVLMTTLAGCLDMRPGQFEDGAIMIKAYAFPRFDRMTRGAVCAQISLMRIICLVTGETVLFRGLQFSDRLRPEMALRTSNSRVLSIQ